MRCVGTVVRGIRTPIIKENDDLATIVVDSLMAAKKYGITNQVIFEPNKENQPIYELLYQNYKALVELFHNNPLMQGLHELKGRRRE